MQKTSYFISITVSKRQLQLLLHRGILPVLLNILRLYHIMLPNSPITAVVVCVAETCSYITVKVHVILWCRVQI